MPPIYSDPALETLSDGISGLEESEVRVLSSTHRIDLELSAMVNAQGTLTSRGQQQLRMLAIQMRKRPIQLQLVVSDEASLTKTLQLAEYLTQLKGISEADVSVGFASHQVDTGQLRLVVGKQGANRGS